MHLKYEWYSFRDRLACKDCDQRWYFDESLSSYERYSRVQKLMQEHALETLGIELHDTDGQPVSEGDFW